MRPDQLSCHSISLILTKVDRVYGFMRDLFFSIRFYVFRSAHEETFFQTIESTAKEAVLIVQEEFGSSKRAQASGHYSGTCLVGRGFH